jgi:hypothetical protein
MGEQRFRQFLGSVFEKVGSVRLKSAEIGLDPLKFSFALQDYPSERSEFRAVLRGQLPTVFDLVNQHLLPEARSFLREKHGFDDVLLVVDDLDKIPQKVLADQRFTNHENLFLDNAATLRAINCSLLLTIPIELAYSPAQGRLRDEYGSSIITVPLVSIAEHTGERIEDGHAALIEIIGRRARRAFGDEARGDPTVSADKIFATRDLLHRVVTVSGGHVRSLLVILTGLLDYVDELPIDDTTVDRFLARSAKDLARGLFESDKDILAKVDATNEAVEDRRFFDLLRNHYVFAYEAGEEDYWYGLNPLLKEIAL